MVSKGFVKGFSKTSGVLGTVAKKTIGALGGPLNVGLTLLGAGSEAAEGMKKMKAAGVRT